MGAGESVWLQPSPSIWGATDEVESDAPKIEVDMAASQLLPCITGYICSHYLQRLCSPISQASTNPITMEISDRQLVIQ